MRTRTQRPLIGAFDNLHNWRKQIKSGGTAEIACILHLPGQIASRDGDIWSTEDEHWLRELNEERNQVTCSFGEWRRAERHRWGYAVWYPKKKVHRKYQSTEITHETADLDTIWTVQLNRQENPNGNCYETSTQLPNFKRTSEVNIALTNGDNGNSWWNDNLEDKYLELKNHRQFRLSSVP